MTSEMSLDEEFLDVLLDFLNLRLELRSFVGSDGGGDHRTGHSARAAWKYEKSRHAIFEIILRIYQLLTSHKIFKT